MTTGLTVSITDELVAELEALAGEATTGPWVAELEGEYLKVASEDWYLLQAQHDQPNYAEDAAFVAKANPATILALLAERAELKRDAGRYRWLRDRIENKGDMVIAKVSEWSIESWSGDDPDAAIDAAMQSDNKE